jgi:tRNA pseudouridine38-40 synthase
VDEPGQASFPELTWHLRVAYDGGAYAGWQVQPKLKTVQGELRTRLRLMLRCPELKIYGCSRTDAGVHALDQQVSFMAPTPPEFTPEHLVAKLNRWLPDDIVVLGAALREPGFNARLHNAGKAYTYCLSPGRKANPLLARFVWRTPRPLDVDAMRAAAALLVGEHDFASFAANSGQVIESTVRKVYRLELLEDRGLLFLNAVGESFLYKMVRALAGFLVHVGAGHAAPEDATRVLRACDRSQAADSAPAQGLFLARVFWAPDEWKSYQPLIPPFAL